jgi:DNA-binding transcriptional MerR regulator
MQGADVADKQDAEDLDSVALYSVSQLGRDLGVTPRALRFYEDKGLISPTRVGNNRVYSARDRARVILILRGKRLGFSLRGIREYLDLYAAVPNQDKQLRRLLEAVTERIAQLEEQRLDIDETLADLNDIRSQTLEALGEHQPAAKPGRPKP